MKKISPKLILALQLVVMLYTLSSVAAKLASGQAVLSLPFIVYYGVEILILGIYAIAWQQIIKRCDLSVAYANRSMAILWSLVWTVIFFHEALTVKNIIGVLIVFAGTMIVNSDGE
ncbi:MAG: EamA family transporter [Eubacteriales bacterium]